MLTPEELERLSDEELLQVIYHAQSIVGLTEGFRKRFGDNPLSPADMKADRAELYDIDEKSRTGLVAARTEALKRGLTEPPHHLDPKDTL